MKRSVTLEPSWSAPTTASRRGTTKPVTRTRSVKQALVDLTTMTCALLVVSFSSGGERRSTQEYPAHRTTTAATASAGLRYAESVIAGSIQTVSASSIVSSGYQ